ncbi:MAG: alanine:cation symporter family protein [Bacteroidales bacterium]|nr:alanine:cation symporter family protein [Bacteroidales bacterium]
MFARIVQTINDIVWSPALVGLLIFAGLFLTVGTRFVQVRHLPEMLRSLFARKAGKGSGISSFEAFCMALSGRIGTGNIVGVATAIAFGGPGAVFWMWLIAFFGAATAFSESTLAQLYNFSHKTVFRGGPFSYIEKGLNAKWLGVAFAVVCILGYGLSGPTVQANGMTSALQNSFGLSPLWGGIALAVILALVIFGGVKSISQVAKVVTPFMALGYIGIALVVIFSHLSLVPGVFKMIFQGAFGLDSALGGILGATIMMGVKRGIYSNEAGQGGGAIVSASADVSHPVRQGLAQSFSVYVDTLLVCTATALMILICGSYNVIDQGTGEIIVSQAPELGNNYAGFTQAAVDTLLPGFGGKFISIALIFFVFTTIMAYYFYCESAIIYLWRGKTGKGEKLAVFLMRLAILGAVIFGALKEADVIWQIGDIGVGICAWINVIAVLLLSPKVFRSLRDYEKLQ